MQASRDKELFSSTAERLFRRKEKDKFDIASGFSSDMAIGAEAGSRFPNVVASGYP